MSSVSQNIFHELDFFAASFILGVILVLVYDWLRIFRHIVRHGTVWISLEDLCYWIGSAFAIFAMLYRKNDGLIRGFSIGGVVLGMVLYNQFISRYTVRYMVLIVKKIIHIVEKICAVIFWPLKKVVQTAAPQALNLLGKWKKIIKYLKKRLKKIKNEIKMGISK